jgi:hypothetical protein
MDDEEARGGSGSEGAPLVHGGGDYTTPPPGDATDSRDAHLDNCKFFLMLAVIFNHCFQDFFDVVLDPTTVGALYKWNAVYPQLERRLVSTLE